DGSHHAYDLTVHDEARLVAVVRFAAGVCTPQSVIRFDLSDLSPRLEAAAREVSEAVDRLARLQPEYRAFPTDRDGPGETFYRERWVPACEALDAADVKLRDAMEASGTAAFFSGSRLFVDDAQAVDGDLQH